MGSYSTSINKATDARQAVTDQGLGFGISGNRNNATLSGHVINIRNVSKGGASAGLPSTSPTGKSDFSGSLGVQNTATPALNILDAGAIDRAFDFADDSLSKLLNATILKEKTESRPNYTSDTVGQRLQAQVTESADAADNGIVGKIVIGVVVTFAVGAIVKLWGSKK